MDFFIGGISCSRCVSRIEALTDRVPGLKSVRVDFQSKVARIEVDLNQTNFEKVARAIRDAGYEPLALTRASEAEELQKKQDRTDLIRLAVGGACAGNIMSFALATYFGAPQQWSGVFGWLSFVLYLPVVTFVAWPFYRGALGALRERELSIDLPMAIASLTGFAFSTVQLIRGSDQIYFDSLSGFLFLILLSRWIQRALQRRLLNTSDLLESLQLSRARKVRADSWSWTAVEKVQPLDLILILEGETAPADGELLDDTSCFSLAFLSGESRPRVFRRSSSVPAGARLLSREARLVVRRPLAETAFGQILQETREHSVSHARTVQLSDVAAQWLLGTVTAVGVLFLLYYWQYSPEEAVRRALALIIVACPCAMAFGTPLALSAAIKKARRAGLLVRDGGVFEKAVGIKSVFLDKTGTLTDSDLTLVDEGPVCTSIQQIILALENQSMHPIAFAFRKSFSPSGAALPVTNWREIPGLGVDGVISGQKYELRKAPQADTITCELRRNGERIHTFRFLCRAKEGAREMVNGLKSSGYRVRMLSGDTESAAHDMGRRLGFEPTEIFAGLEPRDKAHIIRSERPGVLMVGDGVNDALALIEADVGVAVSGGVEAAFRSSEVLLSTSDLRAVGRLLSLSRQAFNLIRGNLALSLIYNATTGTLALAGWINPMVAALLMPASSSLILLNTWIWSRA